MENETSHENQNTQQLDHSDTDIPPKVATRSNVNSQKYIKLFLITLLIAGIVGLFFIVKSRNSPAGSATPTTNTTSPTPESESTGISYGVFYPYSDGVTINNSTPTIVGKITQIGQRYLATNFGLEKSVISGEDEYFLRFIPGKVQNLEIKIDDNPIQNIYGIPQYPTVPCKNINLNPDGTSTYDAQTGQKSPPDDIFTTESECITAKSTELPPLVFFARSLGQLSQGKHVLTVSRLGEVIGSMTFTIDAQFKLPIQPVAVVNQTDYFAAFDTGDNCSEGYYYDKNFLKIPLPTNNNPNLLYGISFPQTKAEYGTIQKRKIQIVLEGNRFELFFPQSLLFYEGKSFKNNTLDPEEALFLPKDRLLFADGVKAEPQLVSPTSNYNWEYFELYPIDLSGYEYHGYSLPWQTSNSSGCDG